MRSSLFWDVTQRRMALNYGRLRTNCRSHLQGSISPRRRLRSSAMLRSVDLKMEHVQASRHLVGLLERASADLKASSFAGNNKFPGGGEGEEGLTFM